ncbi:prostaglandin F2-alpha receptor isoform X2 [Micropterus dolomieu]|uniref:prostaglandin F2-alpha receptor isoform X2 n=1 Tax=Micropterus dolomieu TaxID=147949 RepID=UPI001E8E20D8|nr:prostaglandin F2-alpha receptor isoform X2 [Micropterus dolomieu]
MSANGSSETGCRSEVRPSNNTCSQKDLSITASVISMTVGIFSNSIALFILVKSYNSIRIKSKASFLLFASSLVVTDLLGHLINGSLVLFVYSSHKKWEKFDPHRIMCNVFGACMVFFGLSPLLLGSVMAVERCIGITRPIFHSTALASHHMKRLLGLTWLLAAMVAVLPVLLWRPYRVQSSRSQTAPQASLQKHVLPHRDDLPAAGYHVSVLCVLGPITDPCHRAEHQNQRRACVLQSPDGGTHGHVEPDPGPLGLHPTEKGCSEENLHVVPQLLRPNVSQLAEQYAPQLCRDQ